MGRKSDIRIQMKKVLANLDPRWMRAGSTLLREHLNAFLDENSERHIDHVLAWTSHFPGEPDLTMFISDQLEKRSVYLPHTLEDGTMRFIAIGRDWGAALETGLLGLAEPSLEAGITYSSKWARETVVIVPALAFDAEGNRLGRGKGYYDRFLGRANMKDAITVGVGWSLQLIDSVPVEAGDVAMDWICHERGMVRTGAVFELDES